MRRLIWCMDVMTICTLGFSGGYMYWVFGDLLSRALMVTCLIGIIIIVLVFRAENMLFRHKRRIGNMIDAPAREFTS